MRQARVVITGLDQVQAQKLPAEAWAVTPGVEQPGAMDDGIGVHGSGVVGGRFLASVDDAQSLRDEALASPSGLGSTIRGSLTMYFRDAPTGAGDCPSL